MKAESIIHSYDGVELYCKQDIPENPKAIVVIVHGLGEHSGRYDYVTEVLNSSGYGVFRFDNRGHGKSGGARGYLTNYCTFIEDADFIVDLGKKQFSELPIFMLGHSMGGFITASYGVKYPNKLKGQIFSGPAVIPLPTLEELKKMDVEKNPLLSIPNGLSHLICRSEKVIADYNNDPWNLRAFTLKLLTTFSIEGIEWLQKNFNTYNYPCLIMHGENDQIVPKEASEIFYHQCSSTDKTLKIFPDLYHEILNEEVEKAEILKRITDWIDERI
jgi:acylglycerol lipase